MEFDNERDRHAQGYDAGSIVEGTVQFDANLFRHVIVDDDGVGFDPEAVLAGLKGQKVRVVIVSFAAVENVERILKEAQNRPVLVKDEPLGDA